MSVRTSAGTTLKVSATTPETFDQAGYESTDVVYSTVGEVTNFGEFGRVYNLVTHSPVATRGVQKFKGSFNEGTMELQLGLDTDDAGQVIMKAAALSDNDYTFLVTTQNGDKYYFQAKVMGFRVNVGSVDQITSASVTLELTLSAAGVGIITVLAA